MTREVSRTVRVSAKEVAATGVVVLHLVAADGGPLPEWTPGAHVDLVLGNGIVRQYSLCGDPRDRSAWRLGVLREPDSRGGSSYIHDTLIEGEELEARGPRNNFHFDVSPRYLFVAGGIGITPLLPMVAEAERKGSDWNLVYGGKSRAGMAFLDELEVYGDRVTVVPQDEFGLLNLDAILKTADDETLVYCCGPEGLLTAVEERAAHLKPGALRIERFRGLPLEEAVWHGPFEVYFEQSDITVTVEPHQSIVEVAEDAGVAVMYSCSEGTCGTCETPVLEGTVDHRDSYLSEEQRAAGDRMMICVSRSAGPRLVLEI